jgi:hypothetical protein
MNGSIFKLKTALASTDYFMGPLYGSVAIERDEGILSDKNTFRQVSPEELAEALTDPKASQMTDGWGPETEDRFKASSDNKVGKFLGDLSVLMHYAREAISPILKGLNSVLEMNVTDEVKEKARFLLKNLQLTFTPKEATE